MLPTLARHKTARLLPCIIQIVHAVACLEIVISALAQDIVFVRRRRHVCLGFGGPCVAQTLHTFVSILVKTYQNTFFLGLSLAWSARQSHSCPVTLQVGVSWVLMCTARRTSAGYSKTTASLGPAVCRNGAQRGPH